MGKEGAGGWICTSNGLGPARVGFGLIHENKLCCKLSAASRAANLGGNSDVVAIGGDGSVSTALHVMQLQKLFLRTSIRRAGIKRRH
jgi:hypothetical protein